jgi:hypothetical protein
VGKPRYWVRETREEEAGPNGVDLRAERGSIDQDAAEEAIKRHWSKLVRCYDAAGPARDFAGGPVLLRFAVDVAGRVERAHVLESRLGNFPVERCLADVAAAVTFPRPHGGPATVEYSMEFRATGAIDVVDLPAGELDGRLAGWLPQLAADCHELGIDEVSATLYVEPRGTVRSVGFASSAPLDPEVGACLAGSLQRWRVPVPIAAGVGRSTITLRNQDLLHPPTLVKAPEPRHRQGRRGHHRR